MATVMEEAVAMATVGLAQVAWELAEWVVVWVTATAGLAVQEDLVLVPGLEINHNTKLELHCHHRFG